MFARLLVFLNPAIEYIREKYSDVQLIDGVKWGLIILFMIFIIGKISTVATWVISIGLIAFIAAKLYQKYIGPKKE